MAPHPHPALASDGRHRWRRVKVAVSDIDGVLRGKYLHRDKFEGALDGGFWFLRRGVRVGHDGFLLPQRHAHGCITAFPMQWCARTGDDAQCALDNKSSFSSDFVHSRRRATSAPVRARH